MRDWLPSPQLWRPMQNAAVSNHVRPSSDDGLNTGKAAVQLLL